MKGNKNMFKWLIKKYIEYKTKNHINKEECFVFPIMPKSQLEDGKRYETFDFSHKYAWRIETWYTEYKTKYAQWNTEKDCFLTRDFKIKTLTYEEFKPLRPAYTTNEEINYGICSYNPCDVNALDLEELKKITFDLNDDNAESDEVWEKLITYFENRGF